SHCDVRANHHRARNSRDRLRPRLPPRALLPQSAAPRASPAHRDRLLHPHAHRIIAPTASVSVSMPVLLSSGCSFGCRFERGQTFKPKDASHLEITATLALHPRINRYEGAIMRKLTTAAVTLSLALASGATFAADSSMSQ